MCRPPPPLFADAILERENPARRPLAARPMAVGQFCAKNWQWISGTIVIPVAAWVASTTSLGSAALKQLRIWLNP
jgi:hypothetical protein